MEKPIKMSEDTWKKLTKMKYTLGVKSLDEVIQRMLKIISHFKLAGEMKEDLK